MALINEVNKQRADRVVRDVREYAVLTDNANPAAAVNGMRFVPGVGLPAEAAALRVRCSDMEEGIFKTLVMGKFKNGKSTFINAIVGRVMMASKATACTAVIATVEWGDGTDTVDVIYTDRPAERMTLEQFTREFQLSPAEEEIIEGEGKLSRFENVSHVEMHSREELFSDGLQLIDSPGLEEAVSRNRTTNEFVPKANAIIFTLNANSLFSAAEKAYIAENFAGKRMRNVFFVVNRIDNLTPDQLETSVMPAVRAGLQDVFTDENGLFDEELYNKRVFYTNAYGALCIRTGEPYTMMSGRKAIRVDLDMEDTGMPEFEEALREFLNSDERMRATFSSTLTSMANTCQVAENNVRAEMAVRAMSGEERRRCVEEAEKELDAAVRKLEEMRATVKNAAGIAAQKLYLDLITYAQTDLPREFAAAARDKEFQNKLGITGLIRLAAAMSVMALPGDGLNRWAMNTQMNVLKPFADKVNGYIRQKLEEEWPKRVPTLTQKDLDDLKKRLDEHAEDFDLSMARAMRAFSGDNAEIPAADKANLKSGLQAVLALLNVDVSLATSAMAEGGLSWGEFIKRAALQIVLDGALTLILGAPFLLPAMILEAISLHYRQEKMAEQLMTSIGSKAFAILSEKLAANEMAIKDDIVTQIVEHGEKISSVGVQLVEEQRTRMDKLLKEDAEDTAAAQAENDRLNANLRRMRELVEDVFTVLNGRAPTETEFANLSRNGKEKSA